MSSSKISIALAATALLVSVLFATPLGQAAGRFVLAKNSVGSKQVINGSLTRADLSKKTIAALHGVPGPRGAQGIQGAQGAQGTQGVQGVAGTARAACAAFREVLGEVRIAPIAMNPEKWHLRPGFLDGDQC